jgi:poly(A) polymerase
LFAALLWEPVRLLAKAKIEEEENENFAYQEAASQILSRQVNSVSIPRVISLNMRDVWMLQPRLETHTRGGKPFKLLEHPRFRAAYDFLLLRAETGEADPELADWWSRFLVAPDAERRAMTREGGVRTGRGHRRRRSRKPKSKTNNNDA